MRGKHGGSVANVVLCPQRVVCGWSPLTVWHRGSSKEWPQRYSLALAHLHSSGALDSGAQQLQLQLQHTSHTDVYMQWPQQLSG